MTIRLNTQAANISLLIFSLLIGTIYFGLISAGYLAYRLSQKGDLESLRLATRLQPENAEYRYRLGQYFADRQLWSDAANLFRDAASLNPHSSLYWLNLALADTVLDRLSYRDELRQAILAEPKSPEVAWAAGLIHFGAGDIDSGLKNLRVVLENDPPLSAQTLQLCWEVRPDVDALLQGTVPPNAHVYSSFLDLLMFKRKTASAAKVWDRIVELRQPVEIGDIFDYIRYLIGQHEPAQARTVWQQAANFSDLKLYQHSHENLVVNGNFTLKMLDGGFDWIYEKRPDVALALDPTEPLLGSRSLLISYNSRGLEDSGIRQMIPVEPATVYQFSAYFKTKNMEGAGGPHFVLQDFYTEKSYFDSEALKEREAWTQVNGQFETGPETSMLVLKIKRDPAGSPIRGKLWIGGVRLTQQEHPQ